jgi:hypothetical protein
MATWSDLITMRAQGIKPSLQVVITTDNAPPAHLLRENGFLVIRHKPGEAFHVEQLDGLDVLLFLGNCDRVQAVMAMARQRRVQPKSLTAWCPCFARLDHQPVHCEVSQAWQ